MDEETKNRLIEAGFETAEDVLDAGDLKVMEATQFELGRVREIMEILNTYFVTEEESTGSTEGDEAGNSETQREPETKIEG